MTVDTETFTAGRGVTKISPAVFLAFCRLLFAALSSSYCDEMYAAGGTECASLLLPALLLLVVRMLAALGLALTLDCSRWL